MPTNAGSVGVDYSISYYDGDTNSIIDLGDVQNVKFSAQHHSLVNRPFNGVPKFAYIPDGHSISFTITRTSEAIENLMVTREANFNQNGQGGSSGYLNKTITNPDGTVSRYQYQGFVFIVTDLGDVSREKLVTMTCVGMASNEIQIA